MSKHTPGPWRVGTYGDRLAIYADGIYVAVVYSPPDDVAFIPEATANARLIAEAPAMYEYIKTTMDDLNTIIDHIISGYSEIAVDVARQMQSRAGALLAKIEGRG